MYVVSSARHPISLYLKPTADRHFLIVMSSTDSILRPANALHTISKCLLGTIEVSGTPVKPIV